MLPALPARQLSRFSWWVTIKADEHEGSYSYQGGQVLALASHVLVPPTWLGLGSLSQSKNSSARTLRSQSQISSRLNTMLLTQFSIKVSRGDRIRALEVEICQPVLGFKSTNRRQGRMLLPLHFILTLPADILAFCSRCQGICGLPILEYLMQLLL